MDLSRFETKSDEGAVLGLLHPVTDEPLLDEEDGKPVIITLVGQDSKSYRSSIHRQQNARIKKAAGRRRPNLNAEDLEEDRIEVLAHCTQAWSGIVVDGVRLPCSFENARTLYTRFPWIVEQVEAFVTDRANFLGNS